MSERNATCNAFITPLPEPWKVECGAIDLGFVQKANLKIMCSRYLFNTFQNHWFKGDTIIRRISCGRASGPYDAIEIKRNDGVFIFKKTQQTLSITDDNKLQPFVIRDESEFWRRFSEVISG